MKYLIATVLLLFSFGFIAQQKKQKPNKPGKQIYLLLGQSNMAGRGAITDADKNLSNSRVLMLNANSQWVLAKHPIHFDKPKAAGVGPGLAFGMAIADAFPKDTIYLVPCAVGGTAISKWQPTAFDPSTNTHPYDDAVLRIQEAMKVGKITGAIWLQGESDSNPKAAAVYLEKLTALIQRIRTLTANPKLPFVVGELGQFRTNYQLINTQLQQLPNLLAYTGLVTSEGLTHKGDTTHFDSPSASMYGARFAKGMLKLQQNK